MPPHRRSTSPPASTPCRLRRQVTSPLPYFHHRRRFTESTLKSSSSSPSSPPRSLSHKDFQFLPPIGEFCKLNLVSVFDCAIGICKGRGTLAGRRSIGIADSPSMRLPTALSSATSASGYSCEFFSSLGSDRPSGYNRDSDVALPSDFGSISDRVEALTYAWPRTSGMMAAMGGDDQAVTH
uniref:Uncharacterized protein n=1 Tax=Leersia perrieri TaxID=77586 RepID=A0A0D9XG60_9ORYZ